MAAYDPWQTTFFFSVLSNSVSGTVLTVRLGAGIDIPKLLAAATAGAYASINRSALNGEAPSDAADEFVYQYNVTVGGQQTTELLTVPQAAASPYSPTDQTRVSWTQQLLFQHTTAYGQLILGKPSAPQS